MKNEKRTDPHRKGAIVPGHYVYVLSYSLPASAGGYPVPGMALDCERDLSHVARDGALVAGVHAVGGGCCVAALRAAGAPFAAHGATGKCTVCGASYVYGDLWRHEPTGELIHLGHDCAHKYALLADRSAFELAQGRLRAAVATTAQRAANKEERDAFLAAHPGLADALTLDHPILRDLAAKFATWRNLSDKQIALAHKLAHEVRNPAPAERTVTAPIVEGRQTIRGTVVSRKTQDNAFGSTVRITIKVTTLDGVWLAWGTCPAALDCHRGDVVELTAALKAGRDPHFALFSRPTNARIVTPVAPSTAANA